MNVERVQSFVDDGRPVVLTLGEGRTAIALLVDIEAGRAISKQGSKYSLSEITDIQLSDGRVSGMHRTGDGVRR